MNKKQQQYTIVTLINASKTTGVVDRFDGGEYNMPARSKLLIPEFIAKHWLGDTYAPAEFWSSEVARVSNRNPQMLELLATEELYVKEWKESNLTKSYTVDIAGSTNLPGSAIVATPLDASDEVPAIKETASKEFVVTGIAAELAPI